MTIEFDFFNQFKNDCEDEKSFINYLSHGKSLEQVELNDAQEALFFQSHDPQYSSMRIFMEDQYGCLDIYAEGLELDLSKQDLIS
jgi:hypothetical protein